MAQCLAYLDWVDATWTAAKLVPRFAWTDPDAVFLWQARAYGQIGSPRHFNALKPTFLQIFSRSDLSQHQLEGLVGHLLEAALRLRQSGSCYNLTAAELKRALSEALALVRHHASWQLWNWVAQGPPADRAERWRALLGPLIRDIWPLDARLRDERSSENLVHMAQAVDTSFPDAVDAIADFIVPYELDLLAHSLLLEQEHATLVDRYPRPFLRLTNVLIDPALYPVLSDLRQLLERCVNADPGCRSEPTYVRLYGLSRGAAS